MATTTHRFSQLSLLFSKKEAEAERGEAQARSSHAGPALDTLLPQSCAQHRLGQPSFPQDSGEARGQNTGPVFPCLL